jgi:hypothetical protein
MSHGSKAVGLHSTYGPAVGVVVGQTMIFPASLAKYTILHGFLPTSPAIAARAGIGTIKNATHDAWPYSLAPFNDLAINGRRWARLLQRLR